MSGVMKSSQKVIVQKWLQPIQALALWTMVVVGLFMIGHKVGLFSDAALLESLKIKQVKAKFFPRHLL